MGAIDGASQFVIWKVATSTEPVMERGFRSGLDLKKEEIVENRLLRAEVTLGSATGSGAI